MERAKSDFSLMRRLAVRPNGTESRTLGAARIGRPFIARSFPRPKVVPSSDTYGRVSARKTSIMHRKISREALNRQGRRINDRKTC